MVNLVRFIVVLQMVFSCGAQADVVVDNILSTLRKANPSLEYSQPLPTAVAGLYEVTAGSTHIFVSQDGKNFIVGDMYQNDGVLVTNVTAEARKKARADALAAIKNDDMIVFSPSGVSKAVVYVFTDVDCGFCQKFHSKMNEINRLGIEVRYLAFPRSGIGSEAYKKLVWAHCSKDKQDAYGRLIRGKSVDEIECPNTIEQQYKLGLSFGVSGTPTLLKPNGEIREGYVEPEALAKSLGL